MKPLISLSIAAVLMAACQCASAQSNTGVLRFQGALVGTAGGHGPYARAMPTDEGPHDSTEQTLGVPASTRAELLDYFVATRREVGIEARELKLFTRTYP